MLKVSGNPFKKCDVFVYSALVALIVVLFVVATVCFKPSTEGFTVLLNGKTVMTADFASKTLNITDDKSVTRVGENDYKILSENGYNTIRINWEDRDVTVIETDCGTSKECTRMRLKTGDVICAPHSLVIKFTGKTPDPVIG